jgi:hypothetical protein
MKLTHLDLGSQNPYAPTYATRFPRINDSFNGRLFYR